MLGASEVKHMAMAENISPVKKAIGRISRTRGVEMRPKAAMTAMTMLELMRLRVAPHKSSPAMTSSRLTGVAIMPSKVFW